MLTCRNCGQLKAHTTAECPSPPRAAAPSPASRGAAANNRPRRSASYIPADELRRPAAEVADASAWAARIRAAMGWDR